jgi:hypothetical protein
MYTMSFIKTHGEPSAVLPQIYFNFVSTVTSVTSITSVTSVTYNPLWAERPH